LTDKGTRGNNLKGKREKEKKKRKKEKKEKKKRKMEEYDYFLSPVCVGVTNLIHYRGVQVGRDKDCIYKITTISLYYI
jgi:hypothetical protein